MLVNVRGLDSADLLRALYAAAMPVGMGYLQYQRGELGREQALEEVKHQYILDKDDGFECIYFEYFLGRRIKVDVLSIDGEIDCYRFDRFYGQGAADKAIEAFIKENG